MPHGQLEDHLAGRRPAGLSAVGIFRADHLHAGFGVVTPASFAEHGARAGEDDLGQFARLPGGPAPAEHDGGGGPPSGSEGGADFVGAGGRPPAGAGDADAVPALPREVDRREIAGHVGQEVGARVADLVEHLLAHGSLGDEPAGIRGFADHAAAVRRAFRDGKADIFVTLHPLPIGEDAPRGLGAALDEVTGQTARGQQVQLIVAPAEFVHQRTQGQRAVHATAGDHHLGARIQCCGDGPCAEVGIHAGHFGRQGLARIHLPRVQAAHPFQAGQQVVPHDHRYGEADAGLTGHVPQRVTAGHGIDAPGVGDHTNTLARDLGQQGRHHARYEIAGVPVGWRSGAGTHQKRHGDLGQIVQNQIVDAAFAHQLGRTQLGIAPKRRPAPDANDFISHVNTALIGCHPVPGVVLAPAGQLLCCPANKMDIAL